MAKEDDWYYREIESKVEKINISGLSSFVRESVPEELENPDQSKRTSLFEAAAIELTNFKFQ